MADFLSALGGLFTGSGMQDAEAQRQAQLNQAYGQYSDAAGLARNALQNNYTAALAPYSGMQATGTAGTQAYANATGANGIQGLNDARANFNAMVQPDINAGIDALIRAGNAKGVATGNTLTDATKYATNEMFNRYQNYAQNLSPFLNYQQTAAAGQGGLYSNLANQLAGNYTALGGQAMNLGTQLGQSQYNSAMAPTLGAANLVNLGLNVGNYGAGGGFSGLGNLISKTGGLMSGSVKLT
jgi:hypothetical protein